MNLLQDNIERALVQTLGAKPIPFHFSILNTERAGKFSVHTVALEGLVIPENMALLQLDRLHEFELALRALQPVASISLSIYRLTGEYAFKIVTPEAE